VFVNDAKMSIQKKILEKQVPMQSMSETFQEMMQDYYDEALQRSGLKPTGQPEIDHSFWFAFRFVHRWGGCTRKDTSKSNVNLRALTGICPKIVRVKTLTALCAPDSLPRIDRRRITDADSPPQIHSRVDSRPCRSTPTLEPLNP